MITERNKQKGRVIFDPAFVLWQLNIDFLFFKDYTCYVDCQPKIQLLYPRFMSLKALFPQPGIRGQKPQDSFPIIGPTDRRILLNVTAYLTRCKLTVSPNREDQVLYNVLTTSNHIGFII